MKKSLVLIAVVVVLGLVGMPYLTGSVAESETRKIVAQFNQKSDEYGTTNIANYARGIRSSQVEYEYTLPAHLAAIIGLNDTLKYNCDYTHGITGIDYDCNLRSNSAYAALIEHYFANEDPLLITGSISALGGFTQQIATREIDQKLNNGGVVKIAPSSIFIEANGNFSELTSTSNFGGMEFSNADGSATLTEGSVYWLLKPTEIGLFETEYAVTLADISVVSEQQKVKMQGFNMAGSLEERGDTMDSALNVTLKSYEAEGQQSIAVENLSLLVNALGVNSQALLEYQEFATSLQSKLLATAGEPSQSQLDPNQMLALLPIVEKMLDENLNIKLALSGDVFGTANEAAIDVKLLKKTSFAQLSAIVFNPESVFENMDIRINSSVNKSLAQSHPLLGPTMANSPLILSDGDNYTSDIKIGAEPMVNGRKVTFQELQTMVLSSAR